MHLPVTVKEIQAGCLVSPYFKDLYLYLAQNKLPSRKTAIHKVETLIEKDILLDSLLFKLDTTLEKETALLAIPKICAYKTFTLYHSSLSAEHQGVIKTYLTIGDKFFIPRLIHYLKSNIKGCHICQLSKNDKLPTRQLQTRINLNYRSLSRLSMDLKVMLRSWKGHKYILCTIDEVTNYLITVPVHQSWSEEIGNALIECNFKILCAQLYTNGSRQCMHVLTNELFVQETWYQDKNYGTYSHWLLQAEYGIKTLSTILTMHLTNLGQMWLKYLSLATFVYNTVNISN